MNHWLLKVWSEQNNKKVKFIIMFLFPKIQTLFSLIKQCFYGILKNKLIIKTFAFIYNA